MPKTRNEITQSYRIRNRVKVNSIAVKSYHKNRASVRRQQADYYQRTKADKAAKGKIYREANLEKRKAQCRAWHKANRNNPKFLANRKLKDIPYQQKRRALKRRAAINLKGIRQWMKAAKAKPVATCYWCQARFASYGIHFDHIIPLSKGGEHSVRNLCTSCPTCNLSKSNKLVRVWTKIGQQFLAL